MTITWVNNVPNPTGQMGDDYKVLLVSGGDGVSSVSIGSLPHPNDGAMVFSIWWKAATATTATVTALGTTKVGNIGTDWSRFYVAIPTPTGSTISIVPANGSSDIYMAMAQLEMGEVPSDWRESQDEFATKTELNIVDGKVETVVETVDSVVRETATPGQYQVYVAGNNSLVTESGGKTVMQITPNAFTIVNNSATDPDDQTTMEITPTSFKVNTEVVEFNVPDESLRIDGDGASMDHLTVNEELIAPNVAQYYTGPTNIGTRGIGIQSVFDTLNNKIINDNITIGVYADSYEYVTLSGITGSGSVTIKARETSSDPIRTLYGGMTLRNIKIPVTIENMKVTVDDGSSAIKIYCCDYVFCNNITAKAANTDAPVINLQDGARVYLRNSGFYGDGNTNNQILIFAGHNCDLDCYMLSGSANSGSNTGVFLSAQGAKIIWDGTRPEGTLSIISPCVIACSAASLTDQIPSSDGSLPTPSQTQTYQKTLLASVTGTYEVQNEIWNPNTTKDSNRSNHIYQGAWDDVVSAGCMWFDFSSLNPQIPNAESIKNASLTFFRSSASGGGDPVTVHLYTTLITSKSGNPTSQMVDRGVLASQISKGQTMNPSTTGLLDAVKAAYQYGYGLMFFVNETSQNGKSYSPNYARFDGVGDPVVPTLTITYEA